MWLVAALSAIFLLFLLPATRPIVAWCILILAVPITIVLRRGLPAGFAPAPVSPDDPRLSDAARAALDTGARQLLELGFIERGLFILDRGPGKPTTSLRGLAHEPTSTLAVVSCMTHLAQISTTLALTTRTGAARISSTTAPTRECIEEPDSHTEHFPSLQAADQLFTAHRALVESRADAGPALPPPADSAALDRDLRDSVRRELDRLMQARVLRRSRDGRHPFTLRGAVVMARRELWPRRGRLIAEVRVREEETLARLGLGDLLARARASPNAAPPMAPERALMQTPDDRGQRRTVARADRLAADERASDPRFRALVAQSAATRRGALSGSALLSVGMAIGTVLVFAVVGVPFYAGWIIAVILLILVPAVRSASRAPAAERAAAEVYLRRGICPGCLYSLRGLDAHADGCLLCPECGAAWRRDRVVDFADFAAAAPADALAPVRRAGEVFSANSGFNTGVRAADHREQPCTLVAPSLRNHLAVSPPPLRPRLEAARARMARSGRVLRWLTAIVLGVVFILPGLIVLVRMGLSAGPRLIAPLLLTGFGTLLSLSVLRGNFAYRRRDIITAMLQQRLCPSCGEDLKARPVDAAGLSACLCGCAWRLGAGAAIRDSTASARTAPPTVRPG